MKPWDYYEIDVPAKTAVAAKRRELCELFAAEPLTEAQRRKKSVKRSQASQVLVDEFWRDARQELGYAEEFGPAVAQILEQKVWEDAHADGFAEVFRTLQEGLMFVRAIREAVLKPFQEQSQPTALYLRTPMSIGEEGDKHEVR